MNKRFSTVRKSTANIEPLKGYSLGASRPAGSASFSLRGKVVIQFGGSGLLGAALISSLSASGATLVVASRNRTMLASLAACRSVEVDAVDINAETSIHALRDRVLARHRRIDGIVFNAVNRVMRSMNDDIATWQESMATNATGFFATARTFGNVMAAKKAGSIVNISSIYGMVGYNPWLYSGTKTTVPPDHFFHKGGMLNLTRYLASYYGHYGVRVNAVSPGGIFNPKTPPASQFLKRYERMTMLGRMAHAHEICGAVVFLLSDAASYITGANLPVDGGHTAK